MTHQRALCVHLEGKTLLKAKTRQGLITCASPCLIQQMVQHNIFTDCLMLTVPNKGKGKKATYILTWEIFFLQRFSFLIWVQNTREIVSILVQMTWLSKLLAISNKHDVNLDFTMPFEIHLALSVSKPASRTHIMNAILEHIHDCYMLCTTDING